MRSYKDIANAVAKRLMDLEPGCTIENNIWHHDSYNNTTKLTAMMCKFGNGNALTFMYWGNAVSQLASNEEDAYRNMLLNYINNTNYANSLAELQLKLAIEGY